MVFDTDLRIVGCNDAYLRAVGRRDREEIVGRLLFEAFPADPDSDSYRLLKGSLARVLATGQLDELALIPYDVARPGEPPRVRYWSATHTPLFGSSGALRYILQHTTDVTELQQLREQSGFGLRAGAGLMHRAARLQRINQAMLAESDLLRRLFEQAPAFVAVLHGPSHVFHIANAAYRRLVGGRDVVGLSVRDALPEVEEQGFVRLLDRVRETREPFIGERVPAILAGRRHVLDFIYQPVLDPEGAVVAILVQGHDLTAQVEAQAEVERQAELLRMAQAAGGFGTFEWLVDSGEIFASPEFRRLYGFRDDEDLTHVDQILARIHPDDLPRVASSRMNELDDALQAVEYRVLVDGEPRWLARQAVLLRESGGGSRRVLGAAQDITQRKQWESQLETMAQESAHRVKNVLALAQAIVMQTLHQAPSLEAARRAVSDRLAALATSQTALVDGSATELDLRRLVEQALQLVAGTATARLRISGPDARLDSRTALSLGLVLHELATNALKYGALSGQGGSVSVDWRLLGDADLELVWQECGGPSVSPPDHSGFGMRLIERSLGHDRRNSARVTFAPDGVRCVCRLALPGATPAGAGKPG